MVEKNNPINVGFRTKMEFEKERINYKAKLNKEITQDEFVKFLIKSWRLNKK